MNNLEYLKDLIEELRSLPNETEWVEFKCNVKDPLLIGEYVSAMSNSALLAGRERGYIIWGIEDSSHEIVGTDFKPSKTKKGNMELEMWLSNHIRPDLSLSFFEVPYESCKVVVLEIPKATSEPTCFDGVAFIRIGTNKTKLKSHPDRERMLWRLLDTSCFETQLSALNLSDEEVTTYLDCPAYFTCLDLPLPEKRSSMLEKMQAEEFIRKNDAGHWDVTNLGALLFAKDMKMFSTLPRSSVRIIQYEGNSRVQGLREKEFFQGYALSFDVILEYIASLLPQFETIGATYRENASVYPQKAIRELLGNCLIHQDLSIRGASPMVEIFADRIEFTNPGDPLIDIDRFLDSPPCSRNEKLASFLRIIHICEERGSGFDRAVDSAEGMYLPAPQVDNPRGFTRVTLFSKRPLQGMTNEERVWSCYMHACLKYVNNETVSNASLRKRFNLEAKSSATISRLINQTVAQGMIKPVDPFAAPKIMRYLPYWA